MSINQLWFVRHEGRVTGHFPIKEILHAISTEKIALSDEISPDQVNWMPLKRFPGLAAEPSRQETVENLDEDEKQWLEERAKAAQRWATPPEPRNFSEPRQPLLKWLGGIAALLAVVGLATFVTLQWQEPKVPPKAIITSPIPACDTAPSPKVNWRGCDKSGILLRDSNLAGANLSRARLNSTDLSSSQLVSANLSQADLSYATLNQANMAHAMLEGANLNFAELRGADLSHANLRDANLADAALDGARLDHATWSDGRICAVDSTSQCR